MKRILTIPTALLLLTIFFCPPALAQQSQQPSRHFIQMDKNADGMVTRQELKDYYPNAKTSYFEAVDLDKDNKISHEEWYQFRDKPSVKRPANEKKGNKQDFSKRYSRPSAKPRATQFNRLDTNSNAELSYEELKSQVGHIKMSQFKQADTNGNGTLDHNEWAGARKQFGFGVRINKSQRGSRP